MKAGYKVVNGVEESDNFILVSNYGSVNEVVNLGFITEKMIHMLKSSSAPGFWRIKRKETIKAK